MNNAKPADASDSTPLVTQVQKFEQKLAETVGRVNDPVYGDVDLSRIVKEAIDTEEVQRLRNIKQLGFLSLVFPSATHSRFEHSIGSMHLARTAFEAIVRNSKELVEKNRPFREREEIERRKKGAGRLFKGTLTDVEADLSHFAAHHKAICMRIQLAGLLHDVGHGPFSHAIEPLMPTTAEVLNRNRAPGFANVYLAEFQGGTKRVDHEFLGLFIIPVVLQKACEGALGKDVEVSAYAEGLAQDVCSILNPKIIPDQKGPLVEKKQNYAELFHQLLSAELDIDRMDFLKRDAHHTGVPYGIFDANRLLSSIAVYRNAKNRPCMAIRKSGLSAFEHYLFSRYQMYFQVYRHKAENAANSMLEYVVTELAAIAAQNQKPIEVIPADIAEYSKLEDAKFIDELVRACAKIAEAPEFKGHPTGEHAKYLLKITEDLFRRRKLWKRCFECAGEPEQVEEAYKTQVRDLIQATGAGHWEYYRSLIPVGGFNEGKDSFKRKNETELAVLRKDTTGKYYPVSIRTASRIISALGQAQEFYRIFVDYENFPKLRTAIKGIFHAGGNAEAIKEMLDKRTAKEKKASDS